MQALDDPVVDRERAVIEVARESDAVVVHVAKRCTEVLKAGLTSHAFPKFRS